MVIVLSATWLKEHISRGLWLSVGVGLLGVLPDRAPRWRAVYPGDPVAAGRGVLLWSVSAADLAAERDRPPSDQQLSLLALVGTLSVSVLLPWFWQTPTLVDGLLMATLGATAMTGHMLLTHAYRFGSAASLAPFTYVQIVTATLLGMLFFDHTPDLWAILGMAVIILSGAALAWGQRAR